MPLIENAVASVHSLAPPVKMNSTLPTWCSSQTRNYISTFSALWHPPKPFISLSASENVCWDYSGFCNSRFV